VAVIVDSEARVRETISQTEQGKLIWRKTANVNYMAKCGEDFTFLFNAKSQKLKTQQVLGGRIIPLDTIDNTEVGDLIFDLQDAIEEQFRDDDPPRDPDVCVSSLSRSETEEEITTTVTYTNYHLQPSDVQYILKCWAEDNGIGNIETCENLESAEGHYTGHVIKAKRE